MNVTEKIKWLNKGIALAEQLAKVENCQNLTAAQVGEGANGKCSNCYCYDLLKDMLASEKRIYCGTEDFVEFFETVISTLGLKEYLDYEVEMVDGELEIVIGGNV